MPEFYRILLFNLSPVKKSRLSWTARPFVYTVIGIRPTSVTLTGASAGLARTRTNPVARIPLPWKFWERLPPSLSLTTKQLLHVLLDLYVPVYSQDQTVTELFQYPWLAGDRRLLFSPRGFSPIREANPRRAKGDAATQIESSARGWHISDENSRALSALMELADELGFDLYIVNSPQLEGMLANPRFATYYAKGQGVLRDLASDSPRTHILLSPPAEYAAQHMESSDHITAEVVPDFTYRLASAVTAHE